jgi:hypothetical protein
MLGLFDFFQVLLMMKMIGINRVIHKRDSTLDEGSKIENKLVIIFMKRFFLTRALLV